jgi:hypothetical protein
MVLPRVGYSMLPRVGNLLKKVPKRRKRTKMAKLPVGKTIKIRGRKRQSRTPPGMGRKSHQIGSKMGKDSKVP